MNGGKGGEGGGRGVWVTYDITLGKIKGKHSAEQTKKKRKQTADSDKSLIIHISHFVLIFLSPSLRRSSASMGARACAG